MAMLKSILLLTISVFAISACSGSKTDANVSDYQAVHDKSVRIESVCTNCSKVAKLLTKIESENCGTAYNLETFDRFIKSEPIFSYLLATMHLTQRPLEQFSGDLKDTVNCENPLVWVEEFKMRSNINMTNG